MPHCTECGARYIGDPGECPGCGGARNHRLMPADSGIVDVRAMDEDSGGPLRAVARFASAAEAGYFAHELQSRLQIPVRLQSEDDFDALSGHWSNRLLLLVPESEASTAASALQELVHDNQEDESPHGNLLAALRDSGPWSMAAGLDVAPGARSDSGINWVPIILTLAAGSAAFWGVRKLQEAGPPPPPIGLQEKLWKRLADSESGWAVRSEERAGELRLVIDPGRELAVIREDADGDGVFESELALRPLFAER